MLTCFRDSWARCDIYSYRRCTLFQLTTLAHNKVSYANLDWTSRWDPLLMVKMHKLLRFENKAFTVDICWTELFNSKQEHGWICFFPSGLLNINPVSEDLGTAGMGSVRIKTKTDYFWKITCYCSALPETLQVLSYQMKGETKGSHSLCSPSAVQMGQHNQ